MEEKKHTCFRWSRLVLMIVLTLVGVFVCVALISNKTENQAEIVLDKDMTPGVRLKEFNRLLDKLPNGDHSLRTFSPEILRGFTQLILDKDDALGLREGVAEVLLWRDPEGEMRTTIASLIKDRSQPLSLRSEALKVCTDQALLSAVIMSGVEKKEFRNLSIWRSEDKKMLRGLLQSDSSDSSDMRYLVAGRLCMIDKEWLRNIVLKQNADPPLRVALMSFCFRGDEKVLDSVFFNRGEHEVVRAMALENMAGYTGASRHNIKTDRFLMTIMMNSDEGPLVRSTALIIYKKGGW